MKHVFRAGPNAGDGRWGGMGHPHGHGRRNPSCNNGYKSLSNNELKSVMSVTLRSDMS